MTRSKKPIYGEFYVELFAGNLATSVRGYMGFDVDTCDCCHRLTMEANAVKIGGPESKLAILGMKQWVGEWPLAESIVLDDGTYACEVCDGNFHRGNNDASTSKALALAAKIEELEDRVRKLEDLQSD